MKHFKGNSQRLTVLGALLWSLAVVLAFVSQYLLTSLQRTNQGLILYFISAVLGIIAVTLIDKASSFKNVNNLGNDSYLNVSTDRHSLSSKRYWLLAKIMMIAGLAAIFFSVYVNEVHQSYRLGLWLWISSLCFSSFSLWLGSRTPWCFKINKPTKAQLSELAIVVGILLIALAARLPYLADIPRDVHGDEAEVGMAARGILHGDIQNMFVTGWATIPNLSYAIQAVPMFIFGDDLYGLRMASVIQGILSVLLIYLIAKKLFSVRVAAISAFLLSVAQMHIHYSRLGIDYMQSGFAGLLLFYFLLLGIERQRALYFLFAGFAAGLCFEVYYASRIMPAIAGLYLVYRAVVEKRFFKNNWKGILAMAFGSVIFLAPLIVFYSHSPHAFLTRPEQVSLLNPDVAKYFIGKYNVSGLAGVLKIHTKRSILAFNLFGETSTQYAQTMPLLDFWTSALFALGLFIACYKVRRHNYFLLVSVFWVNLIVCAILTDEALFSPRINSLIPWLFIFPALVIDYGWKSYSQLFKKNVGRIFVVLVCGFLILSTYANYHDYFVIHTNEKQTGGYTTLVSKYIIPVNGEYRIYLFSSYGHSLRAPAPRFLLPEIDGVDIRNETVQLPLDRVPENKGIVFIVELSLPDAEKKFNEIKQAYPAGREETFKRKDGVPLFQSYFVERDDLLKANPNAMVDKGSIPALMPSELNATNVL